MSLIPSKEQLQSLLREYIETDPLMKKFVRRYGVDVEQTVSSVFAYETTKDSDEPRAQFEEPKKVHCLEITFSVYSERFSRIRRKLHDVVAYLYGKGYDRRQVYDILNAKCNCAIVEGNDAYCGIDIYGDGVDDWNPCVLPETLFLTEGCGHLDESMFKDIRRVERFLRRARKAMRTGNRKYFYTRKYLAERRAAQSV